MASDPDDNIFLECADAAGADYPGDGQSGNQKHFPRFWKKAKIITPREFIGLVAPHLIPQRIDTATNSWDFRRPPA
jgi:predicted nucleic acid-binding protein